MGLNRSMREINIRDSLLGMQNDALEYMEKHELDAYPKAWGFTYERGWFIATKNIYEALHSITTFWENLETSSILRDYSEAFILKSVAHFKDSEYAISVGDSHRAEYYKALADNYEIQHKVLKDILERDEYDGN